MHLLSTPPRTLPNSLGCNRGSAASPAFHAGASRSFQHRTSPPSNGAASGSYKQLGSTPKQPSRDIPPIRSYTHARKGIPGSSPGSSTRP